MRRRILLETNASEGRGTMLAIWVYETDRRSDRLMEKILYWIRLAFMPTHA